ncbi:hypothetical protein [Roseivirga seohaensis]|uniref:hypothetical protein n=1 Tax=Roseivirga seohaensis TaxID=1914963 RepID=UPI003BADB4DE
MYLGGQILGGKSGSGGGKLREVETNTERNALEGKIADGTEVLVLNATIGDDADATIKNPNKPWARYRYNKDGDPVTWLKTGEEESIDISLYSELPDSAVTSQTYGDIPAGTTWAALKGRDLMGVVLDFIFATVYHSYISPTAATNVTTENVEVGEVFNQAVTASFNQNNGGAANRVRIQINEADAQDTELPGDVLDYTYDDNAVVLADGQTRRYRTIISYDEGPIINDVSRKGKPSPGHILAGSATSATRTKTARRKIFWGKSIADPTTSAAIRALSWQWNNNLTLTIPIIDGDSDIVVITPSALTLANVTFNGAVPLDQTAEMLATEVIVSVEGGGAGYAQNHRKYRLAPESPYTASSYSITFKAV